jgi:hypothetical protein
MFWSKLENYILQSKKQIPKIKDILRIEYIIQNKTQFETVNFRLYFKVVFRQNEIPYFTHYISYKKHKNSIKKYC